MASEEMVAPRFLDTYGVAYSFTTLFGLAAVSLLAIAPAYAEDTTYFLLLAWPPLAAVAALLATEPRPGSWLGLAGRTVLITGVAAFATVLAITFAIPLINLAHARPLLAPRGVPGTVVGIIACAAFIVVPLVAGFRRLVRASGPEAAGGRVRAVAVAAALVVALVIAAFTLVPGLSLDSFLRDDQAYAALMVVSWYGPAYALFTAWARSFGLG